MYLRITILRKIAKFFEISQKWELHQIFRKNLFDLRVFGCACMHEGVYRCERACMHVCAGSCIFVQSCACIKIFKWIIIIIITIPDPIILNKGRADQRKSEYYFSNFSLHLYVNKCCFNTWGSIRENLNFVSKSWKFIYVIFTKKENTFLFLKFKMLLQICTNILIYEILYSCFMRDQFFMIANV